MLSEFEIVQNNALGGLALWSFTNGFYLENGNRNGPILPLTMLVLPMVFHEKTVNVMYNRKHVGGLYRSIEDDRTIVAGLQERMELMIDQTFKSLNMAFASGLLDYIKDNSEIIPIRRSDPIGINVEETKRLISVSKKIGRWFSEMSIDEICVSLKVRF